MPPPLAGERLIIDCDELESGRKKSLGSCFGRMISSEKFKWRRPKLTGFSGAASTPIKVVAQRR